MDDYCHSTAWNRLCREATFTSMENEQMLFDRCIFHLLYGFNKINHFIHYFLFKQIISFYAFFYIQSNCLVHLIEFPGRSSFI